MFVPIHDENALKNIHFQFVTVGLIIINVLIFLLDQAGELDARSLASFSLVPWELVHSYVPDPAITETIDYGFLPEPITLVTYMFLHGGWLHLIGNMAFLWVFGDNVEDAMGHARFLIFYLLCGIAAGLLHTAIVSGGNGLIPADVAAEAGITEPVLLSQAPLIGASGAVAGVIAAYLMLHPRVMVWVLALRVIPLRIYAVYALGLWIVMQIVMVMLPQEGPVAWWAHIGGLVAGAVLVTLMKRRDVPLFDKALSRA